MRRCVAFFRNLNLGQGLSPTRQQLLAAFEAAGAGDLINVQTNGTLIFSAAAPRRVANEVLTRLAGLTGYSDVALIRSARWVRSLVTRFDSLGLDEDESSEVVFFDAPDLPIGVPWSSSDGRLRILAGDRYHAITSYRSGGARGSNAGRVLEQLTGVPGTARGTETLRRSARRIEQG